MKLMIVDDSNIIRSRIARIMADATLPAIEIVGFAANSNDAVSLFKAIHPQVVTMDLTMPEMDGVSCIKHLIAHYPKLNILVISALSDRTTAIQALKLGARGFLNKPFNDRQLIDALLEFENQ